ncbi:uncharacterized protein TNCT_337181 [Trichonephila clavata]|uniref:Uncharacterized protein n=2 Tax=Trichonephila TaxID=2585208 RepID=A0A8X6FC60_TRICU|nr:uncharacterized protein TNCT_337181 [Trichonephila clavata]GFY75270.1 uncharacterized protein TNIN_310561 [Trichonephila inaurata madagascariensis]
MGYPLEKNYDARSVFPNSTDCCPLLHSRVRQPIERGESHKADLKFVAPPLLHYIFMSENNHSEQEDRREDAPSMNFGFEAFGSWESETCSGRRLQQYDLANHRQR